MNILPKQFKYFFDETKELFNILLNEGQYEGNINFAGNQNNFDIPKTDVFSEMQKEYRIMQNKEYIIKQTTENPNLIKGLSKDRVKKLNELFDKKIEENNITIMENEKRIEYLKNKLKK